jgi:hypothetical protein
MFVPRYAEEELREVVARSTSLSQVLRHFGLRVAGGNFRQLRRWLERWNISIDHFTLEWPMPSRRALRPPCEQLLAEVAATSWSAVGRKYGVSDNAGRKWVPA